MNVVNGISTFQFRSRFDTWLNRVATNAVYEELRSVEGRSQTPPVFKPLDHVQDPDTLVAQSPYRSNAWADPFERLQAVELKDLVRAVRERHAQESDDGLECDIVIRLNFEEERPVKEIAEAIGTHQRTVYRMREKNFVEMTVIVPQVFGESWRQYI